jgi:predicted sulfurtransferase
MKIKKILFAYAALLLVTLACSAILPSNDISALPRTENDVPRISLKEAKAAVDTGQAILIDVRSTEAYTNLHAENAISIPLDRFETNINDIPLEKTDWIITYCT